MGISHSAKSQHPKHKTFYAHVKIAHKIKMIHYKWSNLSVWNTHIIIQYVTTK